MKVILLPRGRQAATAAGRRRLAEVSADRVTFAAIRDRIFRHFYWRAAKPEAGLIRPAEATE